MITYTTVETRTDVNIPFTYDHPLYSSVIHECYNTYINAGINISIETSEDNLTQTIIHTCSDDKLGTFLELHAQVVQTVENLVSNTDPNLPFARSPGADTTQSRSIDDDHKDLEGIFAGHYTRIY